MNVKAFVQQRNYKQGEKKPSEWEKIIANETNDKGLISKIYNSIPEKQTTQSKSGGKT